jgi:hypothetical protein
MARKPKETEMNVSDSPSVREPLGVPEAPARPAIWPGPPPEATPDVPPVAPPAKPPSPHQALQARIKALAAEIKELDETRKDKDRLRSELVEEAYRLQLAETPRIDRAAETIRQSRMLAEANPFGTRLPGLNKLKSEIKRLGARLEAKK